MSTNPQSKNNRPTPFPRGTLWTQLQQHTDEAIRCGALHTIPTDATTIEEGGIRFVVRIVDNLRRKRLALQQTKSNRAATKDANPFLPYDEDMFVANASEHHVCLLNKFNVVDHHLLIVTRAFEHQDTLLTEADFAALWRCMAEYPSLGFYNGGVVAGASQPHKHLQLVPLPLGDRDALSPVDELFKGFLETEDKTTHPPLPFVHSLLSTSDLAGAPLAQVASALKQRYDSQLAAVGLGRDGPYNLLLTERWMLLVPRSKEHYQTISINALGFAGSLFVRNHGELEAVQTKGPLSILAHVAQQPSGS